MTQYMNANITPLRIMIVFAGTLTLAGVVKIFRHLSRGEDKEGGVREMLMGVFEAVSGALLLYFFLWMESI